MAISLTTLASDQAAVIADFPDSVTIGGVAYVVTASAAQTGQTLEIAGMQLDITFQFTGLASALTGVVAMNRRVTYNGQNFRIARLFPDNTGASITCFCVDENK